jgi:2-haloacid dehalogenase
MTNKRPKLLVFDVNETVRLNECLLVAAHGWDIAGALWAGWRAAFLSRPEAQLYPLAPAPELVAPDLRLAAERLIAME